MKWLYILEAAVDGKSTCLTKNGLEIKCLTDTVTSYLYNAYLHTGKNSDGTGLTDEEKNLLVLSVYYV